MIQRKPEWLRKNYSSSNEVHLLKKSLRKRGLHTVCESARCPNIGECFSKPTATFMILGDICSRECRFCSVSKGIPQGVTDGEPDKIADAVDEMKLKYVVLTSVTRDDLKDGGSGHFAQTVLSIKARGNNALKVEVLTPDFMGKSSAIKRIVESRPDTFNHNMETVSRLYKKIRPKADYKRSLSIFNMIKSLDAKIITKSGFMVGLGETQDEVVSLLRDLKTAGCDIVTIGQYLRPTKKSIPVHEYVHPDIFSWYENQATSLGFLSVASGPFVRSSYNAAHIFNTAQHCSTIAKQID